MMTLCERHRDDVTRALADRGLGPLLASSKEVLDRNIDSIQVHGVTQENYEPAFLVLYMLTTEATLFREGDPNACPVCQITSARPRGEEAQATPRCIEIAADEAYALAVRKGIVASS